MRTATRSAPSRANKSRSRTTHAAPAHPAPQRGEPRQSTNPAHELVGRTCSALLKRTADAWGRTNLSTGEGARERALVWDALRALVAFLTCWRTVRGQRIAEALATLGRVAVERPGDDALAPAPKREGADDIAAMRGFMPPEGAGVEDVHVAADKALLVALDRGRDLDVRRRALADVQTMVKLLRDIDQATWNIGDPKLHKARRARWVEIERRLGDAALEVFRPGHLTSMAFPQTSAERAADVGTLSFFRHGSVQTAKAGELLARVAADETENRDAPLLEGVLSQGAAEARAWASALATTKHELAPVLGAIARRFAACVEIARRERERPVAVNIIEERGGDRGTMLWGADRYRHGARLCLVKWAPDPDEMGRRIEQAIARAFQVEPEAGEKAA